MQQVLIVTSSNAVATDHGATISDGAIHAAHEPTSVAPMGAGAGNTFSLSKLLTDELSHRHYGVVVSSDLDTAAELLESMQPRVVVLHVSWQAAAGVLRAARVLPARPRFILCAGPDEPVPPAAESFGFDVSILRLDLLHVAKQVREEIERLLP